jgi:hypothetical protein
MYHTHIVEGEEQKKIRYLISVPDLYSLQKNFPKEPDGIPGRTNRSREISGHYDHEFLTKPTISP